MEEDFFKWAAIISPIASVGIAAFIADYLTKKGRKSELAYQNKLPAFKEMNKALSDFRKYLYGLIAEEEANEFAPYYGGGEHSALEHRAIISEILDTNSIFFKRETTEKVNALVNSMAYLCNMDASRALGQLDNDVSYINSYMDTAKQVDHVLEALYKDLNL